MGYSTDCEILFCTLSYPVVLIWGSVRLYSRLECEHRKQVMDCLHTDFATGLDKIAVRMILYY